MTTQERNEINKKLVKEYTRNILNAYELCSEQDIKEGKNWYRNANFFACELSQQFPFNLDNVCAVISALSPACSWEVNKRDAFNLLNNTEGYKFSSYGANVAKAKKAKVHPNPASLFGITGLKTKAFYGNILQPESKQDVTIDRHAAAICEGRFFKKSGSIRLTPIQYEVMKNAYINAANIVNLVPCQLQAIVWTWHVRVTTEK